MHGLYWEMDFLLQRELEICMGRNNLKHWILNSHIIKKKIQLIIISLSYQLSFTPPLLQWVKVPLWLQPPRAPSHPHFFAATQQLRLASVLQFPWIFFVQGEVGYRKVVYFSSAQGVSSSETYNHAPVDRPQCRASMRHITSWHGNWGALQNRMGHFPSLTFQETIATVSMRKIEITKWIIFQKCHRYDVERCFYPNVTQNK